MSWVAPAVRWRLLLLLLLVAILRVEIVAQRTGYQEAVQGLAAIRI